jgi:hypothetical protein
VGATAVALSRSEAKGEGGGAVSAAGALVLGAGVTGAVTWAGLGVATGDVSE